MAGCRVLIFGGFGVSTLGSCAGGGAGAWDTAVLKMSNSCVRSVFCLSTMCGMGVNGIGVFRASVRSAAVLVAAYAGDRLGNLFWTRNISVVSDTRSDAVLGM